MTLTGRAALTTGAAGAVGRAKARLPSQAGARLVLADMVRGPTEDLSREGGGLAVQADLSDPTAVPCMAASVPGQVGRIDILVKNAGVLNTAKIAATTPEEWHRVQSINIDPAFLPSQAFLPGMRAAHWGRVINLSSYAAKSGGLTAGTAYAVSKAAMIGLTISIAREVAGKGVTANAIAPACMMSPMVSEQLTAAQRQTQLAAIPVGRYCEPEEVAHAVTFLAFPPCRLHHRRGDRDERRTAF